MKDEEQEKEEKDEKQSAKLSPDRIAYERAELEKTWHEPRGVIGWLANM